MTSVSMRERIKIHAFSIVLWLIVTVATQACAIMVGLLSNGDYSYMGASDAGLIQSGLELFRGPIGRLLSLLGMGNTLVALVLTAPFYPVFARRWRARPAGACLCLAALHVVAHYVWVGAAAIRTPTLFSDAYYGDGTLATSRVFAALCGPGGIAALAAVVALGVGALWRLAGVRTAAVAGVFYVALFGYLVVGERAPRELRAPKGSIFLLMADSLRFDYFSGETTPALSALFQRVGGERWVQQRVLPVVPRTAPAVTALLTGKLPYESRVTTMFSGASTFNQRDSIVTRYSEAGYCTIAIGEYPGEFFRKYDYGFEFIDAPIVRFREIFLQAVLKKNPFMLATLSWDALRTWRVPELKNLIEGLPEFASGESLGKRYARLARKCGDRPVFAFVFADQPHFPYVQTFPHYLALDTSYEGPYRFMKDAVSVPRGSVDKARVKALYGTSTAAVDSALAAFVSALESGRALADATVVVTGDHGECLYDRMDIMGHGDRLGDLESSMVPWIVFGAGRAGLHERADEPIANVRLAEWLLAIRKIPGARPVSLPAGVVYAETELWMADTANVPPDRIRYPDLAALLEMDNKDAHMTLKRQYERVVNYSKHRAFLVDGVRYEIRPTPDGFVILKNDQRITLADLDPRIPPLLRSMNTDVASSLVGL